jgi:hypothetical protein
LIFFPFGLQRLAGTTSNDHGMCCSIRVFEYFMFYLLLFVH